MYYYGARYYDPRISIFVSVDPLAEQTMTPYQYVHNNPIMLIDPTVMAKDGVETDYTLDRKTGEVKQHGKPNKEPDRIVKIKKNGETKIEIDNIAKGILEDGMNFKTKENLIKVNGENLPTTEDVEDFVFKLSLYVRKEIGGIYASENSSMISHMSIGKYEKNLYHRTSNYGHSVIFKEGLRSENMKGFYHSHPNNDRRPSPQDFTMRNNSLRRNPRLYFNIITERRYGDQPGKIHRTNFTDYGR